MAVSFTNTLLGKIINKAVSGDTNVFDTDLIMPGSGAVVIKVAVNSVEAPYLVYNGVANEFYGGTSFQKNVWYELSYFVQAGDKINIQFGSATTIVGLYVYYVVKPFAQGTVS